MVEISKFDYGFKVTTSSTEMAEIAEIDPLQLTEQGTALPGLYTEAEDATCATAADGAATSHTAIREATRHHTADGETTCHAARC